MGQHTIKVLDHCQVSPPAGSVPTTSLPLNFFDIKWLLKPKNTPIQRLYLYEFPYPTQHFMQTVLPNLKQSLSITLQHFYPCASNLVCPPQPNKPHILYVNGESSVNFTVSEWSNANFEQLIADHPREVSIYHPFVSSFPPTSTLEDGTRLIPLMAIHVTFIPNFGFGICIGIQHEKESKTDDEDELYHLTFGIDCRSHSGSPLTYFGNCVAPCYVPLKRSQILGENGIVKAAKAIGEKVVESKSSALTWIGKRGSDGMKVEYSNKIPMAGSPNLGGYETDFGWGRPKKLEAVHIDEADSVSLAESRDMEGGVEVGVEKESKTDDEDELHHLTFGIDCRSYSGSPLTYFGNCVAPCYVPLKRSQILGENGIVEAAKAIGEKVVESKTSALTWIGKRGSDGMKVEYSNKIPMAGSPKLGGYETDFGWGRPKKLEAVHIDEADSVSLAESRDIEGGVEVGVVLGRAAMNEFNAMLGHYLKIFTG
ncbi:Anthocyanin 5-aromatic acyltransferase [Quillaja saponaria]|uniref:Anthocyanin 5-aromatic acyltransferase n=1 Tax=Quillaja saponaria TaxID=32244 RepID=A0AAD7PAX1_QUISA|nr:Anthocyanin 5-aromatic acyltransferase [Quillaja saponaria]